MRELAMIVRIDIACLALAAFSGAAFNGAQGPRATLTSVAYRVHHTDAMLAFCTEALGARFRVVETRGIRSLFGELPDLTLKLVPIRAAADFSWFPFHRLSFDVPDVGRVIEIALRDAGRVQDPPVRVMAGGRGTDAQLRLAFPARACT